MNKLPRTIIRTATIALIVCATLIHSTPYLTSVVANESECWITKTVFGADKNCECDGNDCGLQIQYSTMSWLECVGGQSAGKMDCVSDENVKVGVQIDCDEELDSGAVAACLIFGAGGCVFCAAACAAGPATCAACALACAGSMSSLCTYCAMRRCKLDHDDYQTREITANIFRDHGGSETCPSNTAG